MRDLLRIIRRRGLTAAGPDSTPRCSWQSCSRLLNENLDLDAALARVRQAGAVASSAQLLLTVDLDASSISKQQSLHGEFGSVASGSPGLHRDGAGRSWAIRELGNRSLRWASPGGRSCAKRGAGGRDRTSRDASDGRCRHRRRSPAVQGLPGTPGGRRPLRAGHCNCGTEPPARRETGGLALGRSPRGVRPEGCGQFWQKVTLL